MTVMRMHLTSLALTASLAAVGCAGAPGPEASQNVAAAGQALTLEDCASQRDACFSKNPILGLLTCPPQYTQCVAAVGSEIPAAVATAVSDARECARAGVACVAEAGGSPQQLVACAENEAECVAAIVDIELPKVVEGTAACVDSAIGCIESSETPSDVTSCGVDLSGCALDQATSLVPPEVATTIGEVVSCTDALRGCVAEASTPAALAACSEREVTCVAGSLGVDLPDVPLSEVVSCAESAASCTLDANSVSSVAACADGLRQCAVAIVGSVDVPEQLTCEQKWTVCLGNDPLRFLSCSAELAGCRD